MILIALGGNIPSPVGPPAATLTAALAALARSPITIQNQSGFYASPAWPDASDPAYVNAVAQLQTTRDPAALLKLLHDVEAAFGRKRGTRNAPRTLDLDLLDYDGRVQSGPPELPHPRMTQRCFVLVPLKDVAPDWRHPVSGKTVSELIAEAPPSEVTLLSRRA